LGYNVKFNQSSIGGELKPEVGANGELGYNVKIKQ